MTDQRLTTTELVSTVQGSVDSVQQCMCIIDVLSKDCEDNMEKMYDLLKQNVQNMELMKDLQNQNVKNTKKTSNLQNENVENMENIGKLRDDVKSQLASIEEYLKNFTEIDDEYPRSSTDILFSGSAQPEFTPNVSTTEDQQFPTITIGEESDFVFPSPAVLDTDSPEARAAIDSTHSPLSPQQLKHFLDSVKQRRFPHKIAEVAERYTRSITFLICQLREVQRFFENIPPIPPRSDRRLELRLPTLIDNLLRYCQSPGSKEQGPNMMLHYLSPSKSNQTHPSSSQISSSGTLSQENLKRKPEDISPSGTPTKSTGFPSTSGTPSKSARFV